jgi:glycosyltransferase involved in cell wall biosynthesis
MPRKMHICIITSSRVFDGALGGEGRYAISLYNWLSRNNMDVTLIGNSLLRIKTLNIPNTLIQNEKIMEPNKKYNTKSVPYFVYMIFRLYISIRWIIKILTIHLRSPITLIHAQDTGYSGLAAVIASKVLKIPVIVSSHGIRHKTIEHSLSSKLKKIINKIELKLDIFTINNANNIIKDNRSIKTYFEKMVSKKIEVIPIPVKLCDFKYSESNRKFIRKELDIDESTKVIGFIGRFAPEKNLFLLLTAFYKVLQTNYDMKLLLVGAGPLESSMKDYIKNMKFEANVIFCGIRQDVNKVLSSLDIFVLPSYIEGMSASLLEAMASSRSIICSNIPTNAELISNKKEGILIDPYNVDSVEQAIRLILNDDLLKSELELNAKKKATQYDVDIVFPTVFNLYEKVLESH